MKNSEDYAKRILSLRDKHYAKIKRRNSMIKRYSAVAVSMAFVITAGVKIWDNIKDSHDDFDYNSPDITISETADSITASAGETHTSVLTESGTIETVTSEPSTDSIITETVQEITAQAEINTQIQMNPTSSAVTTHTEYSTQTAKTSQSTTKTQTLTTRQTNTQISKTTLKTTAIHTSATTVTTKVSSQTEPSKTTADTTLSQIQTSLSSVTTVTEPTQSTHTTVLTTAEISTTQTTTTTKEPLPQGEAPYFYSYPFLEYGGENYEGMDFLKAGYMNEYLGTFIALGKDIFGENDISVDVECFSVIGLSTEDGVAVQFENDSLYIYLNNNLDYETKQKIMSTLL